MPVFIVYPPGTLSIVGRTIPSYSYYLFFSSCFRYQYCSMHTDTDPNPDPWMTASYYILHGNTTRRSDAKQSIINASIVTKIKIVCSTKYAMDESRKWHITSIYPKTKLCGSGREIYIYCTRCTRYEDSWMITATMRSRAEKEREREKKKGHRFLPCNVMHAHANFLRPSYRLTYNFRPIVLCDCRLPVASCILTLRTQNWSDIEQIYVPILFADLRFDFL